MLESLIEYLNALITPLGFRTYGLTHLVEKEDISFPAIYERKGEFSPMNGEVPTVYHRLLDGPNDTDDPEDESPVNNPIVTRTYSMRAVAVFPFDLYGDDNQYQEDKVIRNLNNQLKQRNIKTLRASLKLIEVSAQPGASARGTDVWEEEFAGIDWKGKRRIVSVDYDVTFRGFADCVATIGCGEGEIDVTQAIIDEYCPECEETPCDPASITTNGDSPALEVASGASQDIAIHDTAGADVGTRSGATVTVADTTVTVNNSAYGTTEAESTLNVEVVDDGDNPVGSLSGGKWVVPAASDPNLLLHLDAGNPSSYPGSGSTWADLSGNGNDFTLNGSFSHSPTLGGGALEFEGSGEYAEIANGNGIFSVQEFTIIIWFYYTSLETIMGLWSYDFTSYSNPYYAQHIRVTGNNLNIHWNDLGGSFGGIPAAGVFTPGNWYQVAFVSRDNTPFSALTMRGYINGSQVVTTANSPGITYYNQETWIGKVTWDNTQNGKFSIVKFYNRGFSAVEVQAEYDANKSRFGLP